MIRRPYLLAFALGGCALIHSDTLAYDYSFDVQHFAHSFGDRGQSSTVPSQDCDPSAASDICASLPLPNTSVSSGAHLACDPQTRTCEALAEVHLNYPVDLTQQSLPSPVVQFTVDSVSIKKIAYWVSDMLSVPVPQIDLYVAPAAAVDQTDPQATLVGSMAMLPASATACADAVDDKGDSAAEGYVVCDLKLTESGKSALARFVKSYQTPFQLIAHTTLVAHGGEPWPAGDIDLYLRPSVSFSVFK